MAIVSAFSPLFIGAQVSTKDKLASLRGFATFSPLFIGAQVSTCFGREDRGRL